MGTGQIGRAQCCFCQLVMWNPGAPQEHQGMHALHTALPSAPIISSHWQPKRSGPHTYSTCCCQDHGPVNQWIASGWPVASQKRFVTRQYEPDARGFRPGARQLAQWVFPHTQCSICSVSAAGFSTCLPPPFCGSTLDVAPIPALSCTCVAPEVSLELNAP